jgi:hypothetical protein
LEEGRWGKERAIEGVNLIKVQYMHIWNTMVKSLCTINIHLKKKQLSNSIEMYYLEMYE